jgi:hypothetical protein
MQRYTNNVTSAQRPREPIFSINRGQGSWFGETRHGFLFCARAAAARPSADFLIARSSDPPYEAKAGTMTEPGGEAGESDGAGPRAQDPGEEIGTEGRRRWRGAPFPPSERSSDEGPTG